MQPTGKLYIPPLLVLVHLFPQLLAKKLKRAAVCAGDPVALVTPKLQPALANPQSSLAKERNNEA